MAKGVLLIISGPSGSGKGTIVEQLVSELGYCVSISATTRNPRPNEKDGIHYFFKTKEEFEKKIKDKYPEFTIDYNDENCIKVIEYTQGDRVKTIKIGNLELSGVEVRSLLALRSANFTTQISENEINPRKHKSKTKNWRKRI